jgi:hypothetical protein
MTPPYRLCRYCQQPIVQAARTGRNPIYVHPACRQAHRKAWESAWRRRPARKALDKAKQDRRQNARECPRRIDWLFRRAKVLVRLTIAPEDAWARSGGCLDGYPESPEDGRGEA